MKLDLSGVNLLAELEGLELQVYKCSAGVWLGLGNTFTRTAARLKEVDTVTKEQTYYLFYLIAAKFEKAINENVKVKNKSKSILTPFYFALLIIYRIAGFNNSTLLESIKC
jgi:lysozyme